VAAIQFLGTNMAEVTEFLKPDGPWNPQGANAQCPLKVWTQAAGPVPVLLGQWIVRDPVRGLCVLHAGVFAALVEPPAEHADKADKAEKPAAHRKPAHE
jgi:hypothetical protein